MNWDGTGTFVRDDGFLQGNNICSQQEANAIGIQSDRFDNEFNNLVSGLENCLTRDSQTPPTAPVNLNSQKAINAANATSATDLVNLQTLQNRGIIHLGETTGTSTAYTASASPAIASYVSGQKFAFRPHVTNGASVTLNVNGVGPKSLATASDAAVKQGALPLGALIIVVYDDVIDGFVHVNQTAMPFTQYVPSLAGHSGLFLSSVTTFQSDYKIVDDMCFFIYRMQATLSGGGSGIFISLNLPIAAYAPGTLQSAGMSCSVKNFGSWSAGGLAIIKPGDVLELYRGDVAPYVNSTDNEWLVNGFYKVA